MVSPLWRHRERGSNDPPKEKAQMIMLADNHPDIVEFIISKMQNPRILRYLIENMNDESIIQHAKDKLKFIPLTQQEEASINRL